MLWTQWIDEIENRVDLKKWNSEIWNIYYIRFCLGKPTQHIRKCLNKSQNEIKSWKANFKVFNLKETTSKD